MIFLDKGRFLIDFDPEAETVITTIRDVDGVMLNETERWYVNFIVSGLKGIGVWDKIKALYGFVGGTAASHKWNWKDMRDLDEAFRLSFSNIAHSMDGIVSDETLSKSYSDTHFVPSEHLQEESSHLCVVTFKELPVIESKGSLPVEMGVQDNGTDKGFTLCSYIFGGCIIDAYGNNNRLFVPSSGFKGVSLGTKNGANVFLLRNSSIVGGASFGGVLPDSNLFLNNYGGASGGNILHSSRKIISFSTVGQGVSELEAIQMSHVITTAQAILGR